MTGQLGFVFPGQGSQSVGMLSAVADCAVVKKTVAMASDVLGYDLWKIIESDPDDQLNQTEYTQPALLAADIALWHLWCERQEDRPVVMAGHSLGEFSAFVAAGSLAFEDAIMLVSKRGQFMQAAVPTGEGAMAAIIGLDDEAVQTLCDSVANGEVVAPANFNSIGQVVIAGQTAAVERAVDAAKSAGAKLAKLIPVSVPSHCALMAPAAQQLAAILSAITIASPNIPVIQNVDVMAHQDPEKIRRGLIEQLTQPVRWVQTIQKMQSQGVSTMVECGPGNVLRGLIKRISRDILLESVI